MTNNSTKVITGKVRFSYANVWQPKSINGGDEKYSVCIIIPKSDKVTISKIGQAIELAKKEGAAKLTTVTPENLKLPIHDGDAERAEDEAYENTYYINANSNLKPGIVDRNLKAIVEESKFYSGCYGRASIVFYAYNSNGNTGIACALHNLQKLEEGTQLSGRSRAEDDFDDFLD
ncbi:hypothetical protein SH2C18_45690 [Clostridium sediminicola]|uniref:DUF2815 family protein n=1 Tax=Clostridium sediminicola TaxID=3114879 RepID=UPI0031F22568